MNIKEAASTKSKKRISLLHEVAIELSKKNILKRLAQEEIEYEHR